jgi:hypothetical protein
MIDYEKDLGAEMGMLYISKNMYPYSVRMRKGEVRFTQETDKHGAGLRRNSN